MAKKQKKSPYGEKSITFNKKAAFNFQLNERFHAGLVLLGWEVKSIRSGRIQINESYVIIRKGEAWLLGAHITPLPSASTHVDTANNRTRKLLLKRKELNQLIGATEQKGFTLVPVAMYWKKNRIKLEIALGKGKSKIDQRDDVKTREWDRQKERIMKNKSTMSS